MEAPFDGGDHSDGVAAHVIVIEDEDAGDVIAEQSGSREVILFKLSKT